MDTVKPGRGIAPVDGGEIAYLIVGEGPPIATSHPYTTPKAGHTPIPGFNDHCVAQGVRGELRCPRLLRLRLLAVGRRPGRGATTPRT